MSFSSVSARENYSLRDALAEASQKAVLPEMHPREIAQQTLHVRDTSYRPALRPSPIRITGPVRFVKTLLRTWKLDPRDAAVLLGLDKRNILDVLDGRCALPAGRDVEDRIAYLFHIRRTLSGLFRDEEVENEWLREDHSLLDDQSPLGLMREGSMENLLLVKEYVETTAGR